VKYCPLCAAEYREDIHVCCTCGAALVESLTAEEVRRNPPRLLWIGGDAEEFDAVATTLRDVNIPALVKEGATRILQRFLGSESQICVMQHDFPRALEAAAKATALREVGRGALQKCYQCETECSAALTACPHCAATLIIEREVETPRSSTEETSPLQMLKYCPLCNTNYLANFQKCAACGVELVSEAMRGRPLSDQQLKENLVIVWRGGDPVALSNVVGVLREAGIRHHVESTHDYLVFGLAMPRPKYTVRVLQSDTEEANELVKNITDSPFFGAEISPDFPAGETPLPEAPRSRWNPAAANTEIWSGEDAAFAKVLEACLCENHIGVRRQGKEPGAQRLLVLVADEARAREILREIVEATPPA